MRPAALWVMEDSPSFWVAIYTVPNAENQKWHLYDCALFCLGTETSTCMGQEEEENRVQIFWIIPLQLSTLLVEPRSSLVLFICCLSGWTPQIFSPPLLFLLYLFWLLFPLHLLYSHMTLISFNFTRISIISDLLRALSFISSAVFS